MRLARGCRGSRPGHPHPDPGSPADGQGGGERAYLISALRNTFYSRLRRRSRRAQTGAELEAETAVETRTAVQPDPAAEAREMFAAIAELPEDFRLALAAVDILGLSYAEAAEALGAGRPQSPRASTGRANA